MIENTVLADKNFSYYIYIQGHNKNINIMREMQNIKRTKQNFKRREKCNR